MYLLFGIFGGIWGARLAKKRGGKHLIYFNTLLDTFFLCDNWCNNNCYFGQNYFLKMFIKFFENLRQHRCQWI